MERRAILAAVLMAAVFIVYQTFFFPEPSPQKPPAPTATQPATSAAPTPAAPVAAPPSPAPSARGAPRPPQRLATVDTPLYRAVVSSEGGKLQEFVLRYRGEK